MATNYIAPTWRMPENSNQSKFSNYSLDFNGSDEYVNVAAPLYQVGNGDVTISAWANTSTIASGNVDIFGLGDNAATTSEIRLQRQANKFGAYINSTTASGQQLVGVTTISTDVWYHVVLVKSSNVFTLYLNSVADNDITWTGGALNGDGGNIGAYWGGGSNQFEGKISQLSIFDYALSQEQITYLYNLNNPMAITGKKPVGYYAIGDNSNPERAEGYPNLSVDGSAFDFDGTDDYINCGNDTSLQITGDLTLSSWFNSSYSGGDNQRIISKDDNVNRCYMTQLDGSGNANFYIWSGNSGKAAVSTGTDYRDGNWHHIVGVFDPNASAAQRLAIYIDGVNVGYGNTSVTTIDNDTVDLEIGRKQDNTLFFNGDLSNAQVFNTALSSTEVATLYNSGSPIETLANIPQNSNLKAWWKLNANEIYNNTSTEWSVDNNAYPSNYQSSLDFDGAVGGAYVNCGNDSSLNITSALSISGWFNTSDTADYRLIMTKDSGNSGTRAWLLTMDPRPSNGNGSLIFRVFGSVDEPEIHTTNVYNDGNWHFFTATYEPGVAIKIYVDDDPVVSNTSNIPSSIVSLPSQVVLIGAYGYYDGSCGRRWHGQLSNMQIYNTTLSASDVATLYNNGTPLADMSSFTSLVSWWKLNNTTTGIEDSKGSNNGTNQGATTYPGFVNALAGQSKNMTSANLIKSNLFKTTPYSDYRDRKSVV